jgi:hypothetical protein
MTRARAALAGALLAAGCQPALDPGPPVTIVTETTKLARGAPLPATSAIFDGARVHLRGARGEVLALQVVRRGPGAARIGLAIDGAAVTAWRVDDVHVARPSTAMYGPSTGAGDYPDRLVPGEGATVTAPRVALLEVAIDPMMAAGHHAGALHIDDQVVSVELEVLPIAIAPIGSAAAGAPWLWAYYNAGELARGLGLAPGSAAAWAAEDRYRALFRGYGVLATPELTLDDADRRAPAIADAHFVPVLLPEGKAAIQAAARGWRARLAGTNQVAFAIPIDEPHALVDTLAARVIAQWLDQAGGGVWLAVTDGPSWLYGGRAHVLIAPAAPGTGPSERRWTYNGAPPWAGAMIVDTDGAALRTWGWIGFRWQVPLWYVWDAIYWRDRHNKGRADAPMMDPARDAETFDDGGDHGNLDGVLAYPDGQPSLRLVELRRGVTDRALLDAVARCAGRPAAEAIARPIMPVALAAAGVPPAPGAWPTDEQAWEAARGRLLDALVACAR